MASNAINSLIKDAEFIVAQTTNNSTGGRLGFLKTRGVVVQSGDTLGLITFYGNDGDSTEIAGTIAGIVNGTPANDRMPLDLRFSTRPDVAGSGSTERLRISASGTLTIFTPTSGNALTINGTTQHTSLGIGVMQTNASGVVSSSAGSNGQLIIGSTGSAPAWANLVSSGGSVVFTTGPNTLDLNVTGGGISWLDVTGATQGLTANRGYYANRGAGNVAFTLPISAARDTIIRIVGIQNGWTVAQNAGQQIVYGTASTTIGVGGSLASTSARNSFEMICIVQNTTWQIISSVGNISLV
jgi:hypothetical protein